MSETGLDPIIKNLPEQPGIYKYFDQDGTLIYVGKAKNLRKRVNSYFTKFQSDRKTYKLVSLIRHIEFIVVPSESEALLLENNLIKAHQPKYNILLRDDKTYPYIVITNERFPKVYSTRKLHSTPGIYYGPYTSVRAMKSVLELIKKLFPIRSCDLQLTQKNIDNLKFKRCLEFHLGNCKAPCEGLQTELEYNRDIRQIQEILQGDLSLVAYFFKEQMQFYAQKLDFESAQTYKTRLEFLEKFKSYSLVASTEARHALVVGLKSYPKKHVLAYFVVAFGRIIRSNVLELTSLQETIQDDALDTLLFDILEPLENKPEEIWSNIAVSEESIYHNKWVQPQRGDKKKLLDMVLKNIDEYINLKSAADPSQESPILQQLQKDLSLKTIPKHIECFDNSNLQGSFPVSAMVCFKNGKPSKKDYRHYLVKTVEGPNDFKTMEEVVYRRYKRLVDEKSPLPDLIVIDGGKGQLSSAVSALKQAGVYGQVAIVSIAKRLEEIYAPGDELPIMIAKNSPSLRLLQQIRDETHRFVITFHRKQREKILKSKQSKRPSGKSNSE